tara:strand:+ start:503 stop:838 length:336 start_codon:yes stop_codon:yes gene_type:complete
MKVYHNPRCSKSRCAITYLEEKSQKFEVIEYLKEPLSETEIKELLKKLRMKAEDLIRKGEPAFKEHFKGKQLSEIEWVKAMVEFPKLIERPIVVKGENAIIARPLENINLL